MLLFNCKYKIEFLIQYIIIFFKINIRIDILP